MPFKRLLLLLGALAPSALTGAAQRPGAAVVAADQAYAALAQSHGEWTATRAVAAPHGEMFVPRRVEVQTFGKALPDPAVATRWTPQQAWLSCDGTVGVTFGRWSLPGTEQRGWYEAVWVQLRSGGYKLLLRRGGTNRRQLLSKPGLKGLRAACTGTPGLPISAPPAGTDYKLGAAHDQSLIWSSAVDDAGNISVIVSRWNGAKHVPVLIDAARTSNAR